MPVVQGIYVTTSGLQADLPSTAAEIASALGIPQSEVLAGMSFFCSDTNAFYMWNGAAMVQIGAEGFISPMLAAGDLIYEDPSLGAARLPIGTSGEVLTVVNGLPVWAATAQSTNFEANGSTLSSDSTINFEGDGTYIAASNPSAGNVKFALNYSGLVSALETSLDATFDANGSAASALSAAESFATSAVATETSRAESAEALLAPKANPTFTGTVSGITAAMVGADASGAAATAQANAETFATSAVATETSRAELAEALLAPLANPTFTGTVSGITAAMTGAVASSVMTTLGDTLYGGASGAATRLPGNTSSTREFLVSAGSSGSATSPFWSALAVGDLPIAGVWGFAGTLSGNIAYTGSGTTTVGTATAGAVGEAYQNVAPTVTGSSTTLALSTSTAPTNPSGTTWVYTLAASQSGAASNGWVNASVTISGYTGSATGNNGTFLITASTATTITVTNASGTTVNTGTPVLISSANVLSPSLTFSTTYGSGSNGASASDTWTVQSTFESSTGSTAAAPTGPNPTPVLAISHTGSSGGAHGPVVQIPGCLQFNNGGTCSFDSGSANGATLALTQQNGTGSAGSISWGNSVGWKFTTSAQGYQLGIVGNFVGQTNGCVASIGNGSSFTAGYGTVVGLDVGNGYGPSGWSGLTFAPTVGTAAFIGLRIDPTISNTAAAASQNISSATISSATTAQVTVTSNAAFTANASIVISGITTTGFTGLNGTWTVASVSGSTLINLTTTGLSTKSAASCNGAIAITPSAYTALLVNPTETAVPAVAANLNMLIDAQVGGVRKWGITNKGHVITGAANNDGSGVLTISSSTSASVVYSTPYNSTPVVVITPVGTAPSAATFYISAASATGFTVTASTSGSYTVNYMVVGNPN